MILVCWCELSQSKTASDNRLHVEEYGIIHIPRYDVIDHRANFLCLATAGYMQDICYYTFWSGVADLSAR